MLLLHRHALRQISGLVQGSPLFSGVSFNSTSFSQRTSCFPGVTQKLLLFPVYTSFFRSSPYFHGVSNESTSFSSSSTR